jgi:hypothetical protein
MSRWYMMRSLGPVPWVRSEGRYLMSKVAVLGSCAATLIVVGVGAVSAGLFHQGHRNDQPATGAPTAGRSPSGSVIGVPPTLTGALRTEYQSADRLVNDRFRSTATEPWADTESVIHVGVTRSADVRAIRTALNAAGAHDVVLTPVKYSVDDLDQIATTVLTQPGMEHLTSSVADPARDVVVVTADKVTAELKAALTATYGDAVVLQTRPESYAADSH